METTTIKTTTTTTTTTRITTITTKMARIRDKNGKSFFAKKETNLSFAITRST